MKPVVLTFENSSRIIIYNEELNTLFDKLEKIRQGQPKEIIFHIPDNALIPLLKKLYFINRSLALMAVSRGSLEISKYEPYNLTVQERPAVNYLCKDYIKYTVKHLC